MGYNYSERQKEIVNSSGKSLTDQITLLNFNVTKSIKIFSIIIRIFICFILYAILSLDVITSLYAIKEAIIPISILTTYFFSIIIILRKVLTLDKAIHTFYDLVYIVLEVIAVYIAILTFPTHDANIYINSLRGFWFVLIILASFAGQWYYGIISSLLVAILNITLIYFYEPIAIEFAKHNFEIETIIPKIQIYAYSIYYLMTGFFIAFPFYIFRKNQTLATEIKLHNIVAQPYYDLSLDDGDTNCSNKYLITKITTSTDIVGADYVSFKCLDKNDNIAALIIGDTIGHGLNRSPGAIIAMSAFHSLVDYDPIKVQKSINKVLTKIDKNSGGKTYCISMLLKENGIIEYAGKVESLRLIKPFKKLKRKFIDLKQYGEILGITDKLKHTRKNSVYMDINDILMIQTDGAVFDSKEDDKTIVMITRKA